MDIRTNIKISLFDAPTGEPIALPAGKTTRLSGFIVLPSNLAAAPAPQIELGLVADETLGAISVSVATKVIDLSADLYSQGSLVPDAIQDLSAPVTPLAAIKAIFTGGDLANVANGKALRVEIVRFGNTGRTDNEAGAQLITAHLSILVVDQSVTDHGVLTGLGDDDHTGYARLGGRAGGQIYISGTGTTDPLILRATSAVGAAGSDIIFQVGNNGSVEAARFRHTGELGLARAPIANVRLAIEAPGAGNTILRCDAENGNLGFSISRPTANTTRLNFSSGEGAVKHYIEDSSASRMTMFGSWVFAAVASTANPVLISGASSQTADLLDITDADVNVHRFRVTGAGNILVGNVSAPSGGPSQVLVFADGTAPGTMAANSAGLYADDIAGNVSMHAINENGDVIKLIKTNTYTQTYSTADRTLSAYTADAESTAYTGIDNAQAGTPYAQLTDLNALRVAYENLRAFVEDAVGMLNGVVDDLQTIGHFA